MRKKLDKAVLALESLAINRTLRQADGRSSDLQPSFYEASIRRGWNTVDAKTEISSHLAGYSGLCGRPIRRVESGSPLSIVIFTAETRPPRRTVCTGQ